MKREMWLMQKNVEELFELYYDETKRINKEDMKITQDHIKDEILHRLASMYRILEEQEIESVHKTFLCNFWQPALKSREDDAWKK